LLKVNKKMAAVLGDAIEKNQTKPSGGRYGQMGCGMKDKALNRPQKAHP